MCTTFTIHHGQKDCSFRQYSIQLVFYKLVTATHHQNKFLPYTVRCVPTIMRTASSPSRLGYTHCAPPTLCDCGWYVIYIKDHAGSTSGHIRADLCKVPLQKPCKTEGISLNSKGMLLFSLIWGFFLCGIFDGSSYSKSINSSDTTGTCEVLNS